MSDTFLQCLAFTLQEEGGFVDNRFDPGGATNKGITLNTFRAFKGNFGLDVADLKAISDADVMTIYRKWYWAPCKCDKLPAGVDLSVFDMAVNAGVSRSAKLLQRIVDVDDDGVIGDITLAAVAKFPLDHLITELGNAQLDFYMGLEGWVHFGNGWRHRIVARDAAALKLSA